jgi:hypothetical protein
MKQNLQNQNVKILLWLRKKLLSVDENQEEKGKNTQ